MLTQFYLTLSHNEIIHNILPNQVEKRIKKNKVEIIIDIAIKWTGLKERCRGDNTNIKH